MFFNIPPPNKFDRLVLVPFLAITFVLGLVDWLGLAYFLITHLHISLG